MASPAARVINVEGLRKAYGDVVALAGVDLEVRQGEVFALLGPNGAGKTTAVEILEGYRSRDAGQVEVLGVDPAVGGSPWRARIGIVLQSTGAFEELTVGELVRHFAHFYDHPLDPEEAVELVGLTEKIGSRCGTLSGGQQRRLDVALGIVGDPEVVFLDEPTTGLDPQARRQAWALVQRMTSTGKTLLLTTHYLEEAEILADRVAVIVGGRIVAEGTPREIGGRSEAVARVAFTRRGPLAQRDLPPLDGATVSVNGDAVVVETLSPTMAVGALAGWAREAGEPELAGLTITRPSLEDTYLELIARHSAVT